MRKQDEKKRASQQVEREAVRAVAEVSERAAGVPCACRHQRHLDGDGGRCHGRATGRRAGVVRGVPEHGAQWGHGGNVGNAERVLGARVGRMGISGEDQTFLWPGPEIVDFWKG